ncbi:MAG: DUF4238 domain-containing protein [Bryobacteraceae bacterium]|nr:DUF4238 domain-containing protein [Bryobacteraceae bacterium]
MAGRRHHTIPQFILKGFSENSSDSERYTWLYRKGQLGHRVNIKNVAAERDFYGNAKETDLDAVITRIESALAIVTDELRSTKMSSNFVPVNHPRIPELVSHLVVRTQQLRKSMADMPLSMVRGISEELRSVQACRQVLLNHLVGDEGKELVREELTRRGLSTFDAQRQASFVAKNAAVIIERVLPDFYPTYLSLLDEVVRIGGIAARPATRTAHLNSLSEHILQNPRSERYSPFTWAILTSPGTTILGDSVCVFETKGKRRYKPLDSDDEEVLHILFPLSPSTILVGRRYTATPLVDVSKLNKAIASCSYEFFVSATPTAGLDAISQRIGAWAGLLSREEMERLVRDSVLDMLGPKLREVGLK